MSLISGHQSDSELKRSRNHYLQCYRTQCSKHGSEVRVSIHRTAYGTLFWSQLTLLSLWLRLHSADPQFKFLCRAQRKPLKVVILIRQHCFRHLLLTWASNDDPKYISVQHSHRLLVQVTDNLLCIAGYEQILAHRTTGLFCTDSKTRRTKIVKNATGIQIRYTGLALLRLWDR
jgi:hypothetical protein